MSFFNRSKHCSVELSGEDFIARSVFIDSYHEMSLEVEVNRKDMIIKKIKVDISRAPHEPCQDVKRNIKVLEGIKISNGMTKVIKERFGGSLGCTHLYDLFLDTVKTLITASFGMMYYDSDDFEETRQEIAEQLKGTCYAYAQDKSIAS